jgi:hypothetical protein
MKTLKRQTSALHGAALQLVQDTRSGAARLRDQVAENEDGFEDLPWRMILMIGGVTLGIIVVTAVTAYVTGKLAELK